MSLKTKWERGHYRNASAYAWLFINARMLITDDPAVHKSIDSRLEDKSLNYNGTKILRDPGM